jgi:hypothetical protein
LEVDDRARNEPGTTFSQYFPVDQAIRTLRLATPIRRDLLSINLGSALWTGLVQIADRAMHVPLVG